MSFTGTVEHYENFYSKFVSSRNLVVWLPPGYSDRGEA
jgi:hypothetical protein